MSYLQFNHNFTFWLLDFVVTTIYYIIGFNTLVLIIQLIEKIYGFDLTIILPIIQLYLLINGMKKSQYNVRFI